MLKYKNIIMKTKTTTTTKADRTDTKNIWPSKLLFGRREIREKTIMRPV